MGRGSNDFQGRQGRPHAGGRKSRTVQKRPRAIDEECLEFRGARDKAPVAAQGLAERGGTRIDTIAQTVLAHQSGSIRSEDPKRMGFVDQEHGLVTAGDLAESPQRCPIAVHAKHGFGHHEKAKARSPSSGGPRHQAVQLLDIIVRKAAELRAAEHDPVDDSRMD